MTARTVFIDGSALWARTGAAPRPAPALLPPNERRRAPDAVLAALHVAAEALAASGHDPATTASVFCSAHGDLATTDQLCRTLAADPLLLSPTRFHHSVHNAPSGYWAIAARCLAASTALAAGPDSFAAGLLEAAVQVAAADAPVLVVGVDTEAVGPLASVNTSRGLLGVALVLGPRPGTASGRTMQWQLLPRAAAAPLPPSGSNAMAPAGPLFDALAAPHAAQLELALGPALALQIRLGPGAASPHASSPP